MKNWNAQRTSLTERLADGSRYASGKTVEAADLSNFLQAVIRPGDRVCLEGDNQKQADVLAAALADIDPAKVHDLHMIQSGVVLPEHLDVFDKGVARRLDYSYSGPQAARIARMLFGGKIELGAVHTYLELFARYFIDLTPNVALIAAVSADNDGNLYTGPNTEDTPTVVEATTFRSGLVVAQVAEIVDRLPRVDVTEQHLAREALQKAFDEIDQSEDRLRLVIDTIPTLVWRAGPDGVPDFLNQTALDYTGLSLDQAETGWPRAFHPDDKKGMSVKWAAIRESGMPGGLEARLRRFDGEYRWFLFQAVPLRDEAGNIVKWYGSATDIEDRKRAEEALRESEQRFRDYGETASDWFWEHGPDHRFTHISEHVSDIGFVPSGLAGLSGWDIATDTESEPEKWRLHREMLDTRQPFRDFVYSTSNESGSPVYVRVSGKPVFDAKGNFLGYRGTGADVTAIIRADHAEKALRKAQAELAHVTRVTMLGEMTGSIAHEVNQPLAGVIANAEACLRWLDRETPNLDGARRSVGWTIDDGNRASEVIRRVRALAKKTDIEKVPLDVSDLVREVITLVQRELTSHQVSLRMELAPALPMILGDRVQLQQVIINLVMNGIEAMQSVADRPRELMIRSRQDDTQQVLVSVTDCGVGIAAENADRLFNAFFTTKASGMGMGLSICRSIIEAHGGRLWATANVPHGAAFQFTLPVNADTASPVNRPENRRPAASSALGKTEKNSV
jgi:PAS domain S-box-containing protein